MNDHQLAALAHPTSGERAQIEARRRITQAGDGALITTILAVDR